MEEKKNKKEKGKIPKRIHQRRKKRSIPDEHIPLLAPERIDELSKTLARKIDRDVFEQKYAPVADVLKLVGAGAFFAASLAFPALPLALKPFISQTYENEREAWKRFNIHYLKRTLARLQKQKLVEIKQENGKEIVVITDNGRRRILRFTLDEIEIAKPKRWDGKWRLVSYDLPENLGHVRNMLRRYLTSWGFYPFHESVLLHAYPCEKEVEFLREILGIGEYVRILQVTRIENDGEFREFFGV